jgi:Nickel uptake substrate-specific transmembrane region.
MKIRHSLAGALLAALLIPAAHAHRAWIVPAATVLSSEDPWVTFDAAVSNDIFHADHAPLRLDGVKALGPDGQEIPLQNTVVGKYRSVFDLNLKQKGTYKITSFSGGLRARWETEEGERRGWPARGTQATPESFAKEVPKKAKNLEVSYGSRRMETFVTAGSPDTKVFAPTNQGLELVPVTHPNDLFAGEKAEFKFLIDGKPAVGAKVEIIPGGMRYRNQQDSITTQSDKNGSIVVTWPKAGLYWMSVSYEDDKAQKPAKKRSASYVATFEVLPE